MNSPPCLEKECVVSQIKKCNGLCRNRYISVKVHEYYFLSSVAGVVLLASSFLGAASDGAGSIIAASSFWGAVGLVIKTTFRLHSKNIEWRKSIYPMRYDRYDYLFEIVLYFIARLTHIKRLVEGNAIV